MKIKFSRRFGWTVFVFVIMCALMNYCRADRYSIEANIQPAEVFKVAEDTDPNPVSIGDIWQDNPHNDPFNEYKPVIRKIMQIKDRHVRYEIISGTCVAGDLTGQTGSMSIRWLKSTSNKRLDTETLEYIYDPNVLEWK